MNTGQWFIDIKLDFYDFLCGAGYLCWQGEPNFFGWTLITVMAVIIIGAIVSAFDQFFP